MDFVTGSYKNLDEGIRNTKEYQWVEKHAWEYGYVIRYPKDKSEITGIISEPWHLRYVGNPGGKADDGAGSVPGRIFGGGIRWPERWNFAWSGMG